jgi:hypothetical protein
MGCVSKGARGLLALLVLLVALNGWDPWSLAAQRGPAAEAQREFGIVTDPWQVDYWAAAVGARPTMVMEFEHWHRDRTLDDHFAAARAHGLRSFMVSWEPWVPVDPSLGRDAQYAAQSRYTNAAVVAGRQDDYVRRFAQSVARAKLTVYIRYAHEMNGEWYPWSRDAPNFVRAWRHVVDIFRAEGATNARWVFSLNPSLYQNDTVWTNRVQQFWPGPEYVDYLGASMINFGGAQERVLADFMPRLNLMHAMFGKELIITEFNTSAEHRVRWLTDLRTWLVTDGTWVRGIVLSQVFSREQAQRGTRVGDLAWSVATDPDTRPVVRALIRDLAESSRL